MAAISSMIAIGSAALGAAGTVYASNQANKAAKQGLAAQEAATQASLAEQRAAREQATQLNAPYTQAGYGALDAIMAQYGLGGGAGGASGGQPDWNTYIAANPDVLDVYQVMAGQKQGTPDQLNFIQGFQASGKSNIGEYHAEVVGGRPIPTTGGSAQSAPAAVDPTAPGGYTVGPRPTMGPLDVSLAKYTPSPDYQYQLSEGTKNVNSGYAAKNLLQSGAAMKALQEFGQNLALGDYSQWRDYTTGQYNTDRNVLNSTYDSDRNYTASRYDAKTNNLFRIAGIGQAAANNTASAGTTYAANAGNLLTNQAQNQSSYYNDVAANNSGMVNSVIGGVQGALKGYGTSYQTPTAYGAAGAPDMYKTNTQLPQLASLNLFR